MLQTLKLRSTTFKSALNTLKSNVRTTLGMQEPPQTTKERPKSLALPSFYSDLLLDMQRDDTSYFSMLPPEVVVYLLQFVCFRVTIGLDDGWFLWAEAISYSNPGPWVVSFLIDADGHISGSYGKQESVQVVLSKRFSGRWKEDESFVLLVHYEDGSESEFSAVYDEASNMAKITVQIQKVGSKGTETLWKEGTKGTGGGSVFIEWGDSLQM